VNERHSIFTTKKNNIILSYLKSIIPNWQVDPK